MLHIYPLTVVIPKWLTTFFICHDFLLQNHSDSLTSSELKLPLDSSTEDGDTKRRWSADNGIIHTLLLF